ncbi:MAG: hypothetical protein JSW61_09710 [Candidatus Thorarchaeota archaeon]|nr:MAG: hypothetical protein JSW61_09710 [Candidatus Thorarchaeota archaeon]
MQLDTFFQYVYGFFDELLAQPLQDFGIPLGPGDWFFIVYTLLFLIIIVRARRGGGGGSYRA